MAAVVVRNLLRTGLRRRVLGARPIVTSFTASSDKKGREEMDELKENPYYNKYADKIAKLQKTSPEEFLNKLSEFEKSKKKASSTDGASSSSHGRDFSLPSKPKTDVAAGSVSMVREKKLDKRMRTDLLEDKSPEEIAAIWREYHSTKDAVSAAIPAATYAKMQERFKEFKTFLFPLPRNEGYEFVVVQFDGHEAHFTTLINYQAHGANAPECLKIIHYPDLAEKKGIVLMVGEFDSNVLGAHEAQCLANQVELYYANPTEDRSKLLEVFTNQPANFKHMDLVAQLENTSLFNEAAAASSPNQVAANNDAKK